MALIYGNSEIEGVVMDSCPLTTCVTCKKKNIVAIRKGFIVLVVISKCVYRVKNVYCVCVCLCQTLYIYGDINYFPFLLTFHVI